MAELVEVSHVKSCDQCTHYVSVGFKHEWLSKYILLRTRKGRGVTIGRRPNTREIGG